MVNLGCGLDNTGRACDNGRCKIYNLDFPDVIALRQQLLPAGEREQNIPCDLKDPAWFDKIDASGGAVFFASGVFYYFLTQQVRELVQGMADAFPGGVLVFDAANRTAVKMIAKTWLRTAKIKDVGAYFAVSDAKSELSPWDSRLQVSSRGYMLGYNDLKDPSVSGFFRFLAKGRGQRDENADREDRIWRQAMKILVYGAGVLGCNLARNLLRAGKDVTLLARGNWAAEIKQNGLRIKDKFSPRTSVSRIPVVTELGTGCNVRCDLCGVCVIRSWIPFWTRCGRTGRKTSFLWATTYRQEHWRRHCRGRMSCLPLHFLPGIGRLTGWFPST